MRSKKIEIIDDAKFNWKVFDSIFKSTNPFEGPFSANVLQRTLIYDVPIFPEEPDLMAIVNAASAVGDTEFYLLNSGCVHSHRKEGSYIWRIPFEDVLSCYKLKVPMLVETVMHSPSSNWGVVNSESWHSLVGGTEEFMDEFKRFQPKSEEEHVRNFIREWEYDKMHLKANVDWVLPLFEHIFGKIKAQQYLKDSTLID